MKRFLNKIKAFFVLGVYGFKNPDPFSIGVLKTTAALHEELWKVSNYNEPRMFKIVQATMEKNEGVTFVSVWAGPGDNADPFDRVQELRKENDRLKEKISQLQSNQTDEET